MAARGASLADENVLDDVFENYGPIDDIDVDNFIDSHFKYALRGEEEMFSSEHVEAQLIGSKVKMEASCTLQSFAFGINTQINLDRTISLTSPQEESESDGVCSSCGQFSSVKKDLDAESCTFSDNKVNGNRKTTTPFKAQGKTDGCEIDCGIEMREETIDPRKSVVTEMQLSDISDDVGTCWRELGPNLKIAASKIHNLDEEYRCNRDKANALLIIWKQQEASGALAGLLADALESIGRKSIAEKLLGVSDVKLPTCIAVSEGHVISLTVKCDLDADLDNKLMLCEDADGNKYMVKAINSKERCWNSEEIQRNKRFLETVAVAAQDMGKTVEQRRQESLKRISSEVQELRQKLKRVKLDCAGDADSSDGITNCPREDTQPTKEVLDDVNPKVQAPQGETVEQLLQSCEEQQRFCQGIYQALIKLIGEVGQPREDNSKCIRQLCDFTKELRDQENTFFSKIELVRSQIQHLDELQVARVEQLEKWKRAQEIQVEGVEKLLSSLLSQGKMEKRQKLLHRRSEPVISTKSSSGFRRRIKTDSSKSSSKSQSLSELPVVNKKSNISSPVSVQRMYLMDTNKKLNKEKQKDNSSCK